MHFGAMSRAVVCIILVVTIVCIMPVVIVVAVLMIAMMLMMMVVMFGAYLIYIGLIVRHHRGCIDDSASTRTNRPLTDQ